MVINTYIDRKYKYLRRAYRRVHCFRVVTQLCVIVQFKLRAHSHTAAPDDKLSQSEFGGDIHGIQQQSHHDAAVHRLDGAAAWCDDA